MKSKEFLSLGLKDIIKGSLMAAIAVILTGLMTSLTAGHLPANWDEFKPIVLSGLGAFITYLLKNYFTNSDDKFLKKETNQNQ